MEKLEIPFTNRIAMAGKREIIAMNVQSLYRVLNAMAAVSADEMVGGRVKMQFLCGLADGADQIMCDALLNFDPGKNAPFWDANLLAILPFHWKYYRDSTPYPIINKECFDRLYKSSQQIIEVNNQEVSESISKLTDKTEYLEAVNRAYDAQALMMLKRCDVLLAVADATDPIKLGGTLHTISRARIKGLPVIFLPENSEDIYLLEPGITVNEPVGIAVKTLNPATDEMLLSFFKDRIKKQGAFSEKSKIEKYYLSAEYLAEIPDTGLNKVRNILWNSVNNLLKKNIEPDILPESAGFQQAGSDVFKPLEAIKLAHNKIEKLSAFNSNQYRGGFILNNLFAFLAVCIAVAGLTILFF